MGRPRGRQGESSGTTSAAGPSGGGGGGGGVKWAHEAWSAVLKAAAAAEERGKAPQTFLTATDWLVLSVITAVSLALRLWAIEEPRRVVFDEVHFGKFTNYYLRGTYFFDLHPPLAKLVLAALCALLGYDGSYPFYAINDTFDGWNVPYAAMRSVSAVSGGLLAPLGYWILRELEVSQLLSALAALMICFDNGLITMSRFILLDAQLLLPILLATLSWVKFSKYQQHAPFSTAWWAWLSLTGFWLGTAISMKSIGVLIVAVIGLFTVEQLVYILIRKPLMETWRHFRARAACLIILPVVMFVLFFWVHFALLPKSGPGDAFMSAEFQDELIGNNYARAPRSIAYDSMVTIRNVQCEGYLSANATRVPGVDFPLSVVSGSYLRNDLNYWVVVPVGGKKKTKGAQMVVNDGEFRLMNNVTKLFLYADNGAMPTGSTGWHRVGAVPEELAIDRRTVWSVHYTPEIKLDDGDLLVQFTQFRLRNTATGELLVTHPRTLPSSWGNGLYEVGTTNRHDGLLWVVIEHEHAKMPLHPPVRQHLSFFDKLIELLKAMNFYNQGLAVSHPWQSQPYEWPVLHRGISFWSEGATQIYLLGNPFVWWLSFAGLIAYVVLIVLERMMGEAGTSDLLRKGRFMLVAWAMHYLPFWLMHRCLFLHHYFAAFIFSVFLTAIVLDRALQRLGSGGSGAALQASVAVALLAVTVAVFWHFAPVTYGWPLTAEGLKLRRLRPKDPFLRELWPFDWDMAGVPE